MTHPTEAVELLAKEISTFAIDALTSYGVETEVIQSDVEMACVSINSAIAILNRLVPIYEAREREACVKLMDEAADRREQEILLTPANSEQHRCLTMLMREDIRASASIRQRSAE